MFSFGRLSSPVCQVPIMCSQPESSSAPKSSPSSSPSSSISQPFRAASLSAKLCKLPEGWISPWSPRCCTTSRHSMWEDVQAKQQNTALRKRPRAVQPEPCLPKRSHKNSLRLEEKPVVQNSLESTFSSGLDLSGTFLPIAKKQASGSPQPSQRNNSIAK